MPDRWIPILAAAVGVVGGMGGALIGGYVANEGQQERFESERKAEVADARQDVYAKYLGEVTQWIIVGGDGSEVATAQGEVFLVSSSADVRDTAEDLLNAAGEANEAMKQGEELEQEEADRVNGLLDRTLNEFISAAQREIGITE
jgi:hypothetical protein